MNVEELISRQEIKNLRLGFAAFVDTRDWNSLERLFAEDAVCTYPATLGGEWVGRGVIVQTIVRLFEGGERFDALHIMSNPWITFENAELAHGRWYLVDWATRQRADFPSLGGHANPLSFLGIYHDEYRRIDGVWMFWRVRLQFLWPKRA